MDFQIKEITNLLPKEIRIPGIERLISIIISHFVYLKPGDRIIVSGVEVEKKSEDSFSIKSNIDFRDIVRLFKENKLA